METTTESHETPAPTPEAPPPPPAEPTAAEKAHAANVETAVEMHLTIGQRIEEAAEWLYKTAVYEGERAFASVEHAAEAIKKAI